MVYKVFFFFKNCLNNFYFLLKLLFCFVILANVAASKLSINSHLLAKITGTILLMVETSEDRNEKKINIGMNLKSNKRNEEVLNIKIILL